MTFLRLKGEQVAGKGLDTLPESLTSLKHGDLISFSRREYVLCDDAPVSCMLFGIIPQEVTDRIEDPVDFYKPILRNLILRIAPERHELVSRYRKLQGRYTASASEVFAACLSAQLLISVLVPIKWVSMGALALHFITTGNILSFATLFALYSINHTLTAPAPTLSIAAKARACNTVTLPSDESALFFSAKV